MTDKNRRRVTFAPADAVNAISVDLERTTSPTLLESQQRVDVLFSSNTSSPPRSSIRAPSSSSSAMPQWWRQRSLVADASGALLLYIVLLLVTFVRLRLPSNDSGTAAAADVVPHETLGRAMALMSWPFYMIMLAIHASTAEEPGRRAVAQAVRAPFALMHVAQLVALTAIVAPRTPSGALLAFTIILGWFAVSVLFIVRMLQQQLQLGTDGVDATAMSSRRAP